MARTRIFPAVVSMALVAVTAGGCSTEDEKPNRGSSAAMQTDTPTQVESATTAGRAGAEDGDLLTIEPSGTERVWCFSTGALQDLAWFGPTYQANADLETYDVEVVGENVSAVGTVYTVPPLNVGGRIATAGAVSWPSPQVFEKESQIVWALRDDMSFHSASEGETGLLVTHLRFAPGAREATVTEVIVRYTTPDGTRHESTVTFKETFTLDLARCS